MYSTKDILLQVLSEASDRNVSFGKTQLVKILYLVEVEYFRTTGQRLTDLKWMFYHYGPYALELEDVLAQPEFEKVETKTQNDRDFIRFRVTERAMPYGWRLDPKISLLIKRIVGEWKDKPLAELLDYVYFETEPMLAVKQRGEVLDFATVKGESQVAAVIPLKASKEAEKKVAELRVRIRSFLEVMGETRQAESVSSSDYVNALKAWDEEENPSIAVPPNLTVRITKPASDSANEGN